MRIIRTVAELRAELAPRRLEGARIGLVPTMGALHDGHLSLIQRARATSDVGDLLFAPGGDEVYPDGFSTTVSVSGLTDVLEGAHRGRAHFDGVTTVVTKLLNMVEPTVAFFGQKDAQQALVVTKLVRDLNMAARIEVCPTIREPDGLALSSRNVHLSAEERLQATALNRALDHAAGQLASGEHDGSRITDAALVALAGAGVETEYFALVDPVALSPVIQITGPVLALVAANVGSTRLIDNRLLEPVPAHV